MITLADLLEVMTMIMVQISDRIQIYTYRVPGIPVPGVLVHEIGWHQVAKKQIPCHPGAAHEFEGHTHPGRMYSLKYWMWTEFFNIVNISLLLRWSAGQRSSNKMLAILKNRNHAGQLSISNEVYEQSSCVQPNGYCW